MTYYTKHIFLCTNQKVAGKQCCANQGGEEYFDYLKMQLLERELHGPGKIKLSKSGCLGRCGEGPCIVIYPEGVWYRYTSREDIDEIIEQHLVENHLARHLLIQS